MMIKLWPNRYVIVVNVAMVYKAKSMFNGWWWWRRYLFAIKNIIKFYINSYQFEMIKESQFDILYITSILESILVVNAT